MFHTNTIRIAAEIFALAALFSLPVHAQPADLLHRAYELRLAGHDEAALPLLEQAYAANPSPGVAAQLGLCDEAVGRWEAAEEHLHEALAVPSDPWVARHLESLEGAYSLALAHFPRESSAVPRGSSAMPRSVVVPTVVPAAVLAVTPTVTPEHTQTGSIAIPTTAAPVNASRLGYAGIVAGGVFVVGGIVALIMRESIVDSFNNHGCRVGDPMPAAGCDAGAAISGRNATTALAATGLVVGGVMGVAGAALLVMGRREESFPQRQFAQRQLAWGPGPGDLGVSIVGRF